MCELAWKNVRTEVEVDEEGTVWTVDYCRACNQEVARNT